MSKKSSFATTSEPAGNSGPPATPSTTTIPSPARAHAQHRRSMATASTPSGAPVFSTVSTSRPASGSGRGTFSKTTTPSHPTGASVARLLSSTAWSSWAPAVPTASPSLHTTRLPATSFGKLVTTARGTAHRFVATLAGVRQIVIFNHASVAGHDPVDGRLLWTHEWPRQQPNVAQPVPLDGDRLILSAGYGVGAKLFKIGSGADGSLDASVVWESIRLKAKFANFVVHDGFIYGLDDGILVCLDAATGEIQWKRGRYGHGQMILVEDLLLVQTEHGEMVLVEPSPEELRELGRLRLFDGKLWNSPALVGQYLLVRSDREAALFELPMKK